MNIAVKLGFFALSLIGQIVAPAPVIAEHGIGYYSEGIEEISEDTYLAARTPLEENRRRTIIGVVTAYSSSPDETDSTPWVTASNKQVRRGVVATNILPFGTKLRFRKFFGDEIFIVEDRMNARYDGEARFDIWHPSKEQARTFGFVITEVEILPRN